MIPIEKPKDDGTLIYAIQTGTSDESQEAKEQLVKNHAAHLINHLRAKGLVKEEVEDIASETWLRAFLKIHQFKYKGVDFFPWLRKTAGFITKEHFRTNYVPVSSISIENNPDEGLEIPDPEPPVIERISQEEIRGAILQVIKDAPPDYQQFIEAKLADFTPSEICDYTSWSKDKVYVVTYRSFAWLRQRLLERYGSEAIGDWLI